MSDFTQIENQFVDILKDTVIYGNENDIFGSGPTTEELISEGNKIISKKLKVTQQYIQNA